MPNATGRRRHRRLTAAAASVRLVTPQLATESGLPDTHPQVPARRRAARRRGLQLARSRKTWPTGWPDPREMARPAAT
jgi:hypothetical protein